jgi:hypothetical protein
MRLSKDDYLSEAQYLKAVRENKDKNLVFDNTNHSEKSRYKIISILGKDSFGFIHREITKDESFFLNRYRHFETKGKVKLLPDVAIHTYFKNVELPANNVIKISHWITKNVLKRFV